MTYKKIRISQGVCPCCGSKNLEYDALELEGDQLCYPWTCPDCGKQGEEWYSLSFAGHNVDDVSYEVGTCLVQGDDIIEIEEGE